MRQKSFMTKVLYYIPALHLGLSLEITGVWCSLALSKSLDPLQLF